jgi:hypothetical protein
MTKDNKAALRERLGNIDQIREILFGSQLRDYSNRLEQVETNLTVLQRELRDRTEEIKQVFSTEVQAALEGMEKKLKNLAVKDEEDKIEIRENIDRLSKRLSTNVANLDEAIDQQTTSLRNDLLASREKLQEDLLTLRVQLFEDLEKHFSKLTQSKVAREDMAEMLFEFGLRLQGKNVIPELQDAVNEDDALVVLKNGKN